MSLTLSCLQPQSLTSALPRQETAASVTHLVSLVQRAKILPSELRILDLCTGTGCIPLLFQREFNRARRSDIKLRLLGVDISPKALLLARYNLSILAGVKRAKLQMWVNPAKRTSKHRKHNISRPLGNASRAKVPNPLDSVKFIAADVLVDPIQATTLHPPSFLAALNFTEQPSHWDILISNPPYISPSSFSRTTTRSVRNFEPRVALVPPVIPGRSDIEQGDAFYPRILTIASQAEVKLVLLEVADLDQALRVAHMAHAMSYFRGVEIWRDQPDAMDAEDEIEVLDGFKIKGQGNGRSVFCWTERGGRWLEEGGTVREYGAF